MTIGLDSVKLWFIQLLIAVHIYHGDQAIRRVFEFRHSVSDLRNTCPMMSILLTAAILDAHF